MIMIEMKGPDKWLPQWRAGGQGQIFGRLQEHLGRDGDGLIVRSMDEIIGGQTN